jgi:hypothetical protein
MPALSVSFLQKKALACKKSVSLQKKAFGCNIFCACNFFES